MKPVPKTYEGLLKVVDNPEKKSRILNDAPRLFMSIGVELVNFVRSK